MGEHLFRRTGVTGRRARLAVAVALVPLLSACDVWEQVGRGPGNTRFNPDETAITPRNVGSLTEAWSAQVDGIFSEPLLSGGKLYTTVSLDDEVRSASVRAYNAGTGALLWETPLPSPTTLGSAAPVVLGGGSLWAATNGADGSYCDSLLSRLDPATGDILETEASGPGVQGPLVVDGPRVAFVTDGRCGETDYQPQLIVRDPSVPTGSWTYWFPEGAYPTTPSIGAGRIVVAAQDVVYAFDAAGCGAATCAPTWTASLGVADKDFVEDGRPVVGSDGTVYASTESEYGETVVQVLDGATGTLLWRTEFQPAPGSRWQTLALTQDTLYLSDHRQRDSGGGAVEAYAATGCGQPVCAPVWSASIDGAPVGMAVGGDVLYFGEFHDFGDTRLVAFDARGCGASVCTRLGEVPFGEHQPMRMAVAGGRLAVVGGTVGSNNLRVLVPAA